MEIGSCSLATQAVVTGSLHHLNTVFLRYPHQTHQPRPSGCLILIRTPKRGVTCPENIPTWSPSSCPACSSTISTQCPCTSPHRTPAVIPRALGPGARGCRSPGRLETFLLQVGPQLPLSSHCFSPPEFTWPLSCSSTTLRCLPPTPGALKEWRKAGDSRCWPGMWLDPKGAGFIPFSSAWHCWELDESRSSPRVLEAGAAGSSCSQVRR